MVVYVNFKAALLKNRICDYYSIASFVLSRCECNYSVKKKNNNKALLGVVAIVAAFGMIATTYPIEN
jgi:hypothetical protein